MSKVFSILGVIAILIIVSIFIQILKADIVFMAKVYSIMFLGIFGMSIGLILRKITGIKEGENK